MVNLETKGFDILTEKTRDDFEKLWGEYSKRIEKKLKNTESVRIHLKEHNNSGLIGDRRAKFSIHALVSYAGKRMEAEADDWDLNRTFHRVFNKIEEQIEHQFHISDQNKK